MQYGDLLFARKRNNMIIMIIYSFSPDETFFISIICDGIFNMPT